MGDRKLQGTCLVKGIVKQSRIPGTKETRGSEWTYVLKVKKVGLSRKKGIENQEKVNDID